MLPNHFSCNGITVATEQFFSMLIILAYNRNVDQTNWLFISTTSWSSNASGGEKSKVTMTVYSPDERILLTKSETNEAAFKSTKPVVGLYRISFSNKNVSSFF